MVEYEASGLSRLKFRRQKRLSLATLARYRKRQVQCDAVRGSRWPGVAVSGGGAGLATGASSGLAPVLDRTRYAIAQAIGDAGINTGFLVIGFDNEADARKAASLIKKATASRK